MWRGNSPRRLWRVVIAVTVGALAILPAAAGVRTTSVTRAYVVPGTTAKAVVTYMQRHPFPGDSGGAFANIRPSYSLSVETRPQGGICRASKVDLAVRFVITLPEARDYSRMSPGTQRAWRGFAAFAQRHEEAHRLSYIGCAERFVAQARRQTAKSCRALESTVRRMLQQARRDCEAKQAAFDRRQPNAVRALALFNMAGY